MTFPLFIDMKFPDDDPNPLSEVMEVALSYMTPNGLATPTVFVMDDKNDGELWKKALEWVTGFQRQVNAVVTPVGWNVRNLVWPAFVANIARVLGPEGVKAMPQWLLQQKEKRWSNVDMVDVANLVVQGGYVQEPIRLEDAAWFFLEENVTSETSAADRLRAIYGIYTKYV